MKKMMLIVVTGMMAICCGCATTAGPFVTNVVSDGQGNVVVEKATLELNTFDGSMTMTNKTKTTVNVVPQKEVK